MSKSKQPRGSVNPTKLSHDQFAELLSQMARRPVTAQQIADDIAAGAPTNADGTINLINFCAWLVNQAK